MQLFISANHLPSIRLPRGITPVNFHWDLNPWPETTTREYVAQAFSNGVNPATFKGPFVLDIEPEALWGQPGAEFDKWLGISTRAAVGVRKAFKNELLAYDAAGGRDEATARRNIRAARRMLLSLDGAGISAYPRSDGTFSPTHQDFVFEAMREMRKEADRLDWKIGVWLNNWGGSKPVSLRVWRQMLRWAADRGLDFIGFWQASWYYNGYDMAKAAAELPAFVDAMREYA
jgi:hypothetical protein